MGVKAKTVVGDWNGWYRFEGYLGVRLFDRQRSGLGLTNEGRRLFSAVAAHVERINQATAAIRADAGEEKLSMTTMNSFASQWLMPRLSGFQKLHPNVRLRLETTLVVLDLNSGDTLQQRGQARLDAVDVEAGNLHRGSPLRVEATLQGGE